MHLVVVGLNHRTAPVDIRERLSLPESEMPDALSKIRMCGCVSECCILSTCNRTEVYAVTDCRENDALLIDYLSSLARVPKDDFQEHLYVKAGHKAVTHLFRVSSGLDSMMLGEAQILGQVKTAYCIAGDCSCTSTVLNTLFQQALAVGKRARTETDIARGAFSVGRAAVTLANSIFGNLTGRSILIIGAGKMSEITARHLAAGGTTSLTVTNRTYERARELAEVLGGSAVEFDNMADAVVQSDIVISSTGANTTILKREDMSKIIRARRERPLFLIDIAVPRDISPDVGDLDNVFLYNIDDLQHLVAQSAGERAVEVEKVEAIIVQETQSFNAWLRGLEAVPLIRLLREKFEAIKNGEMEKYKGRLSHLSSKDQETVEALLQSVVNKISHNPMVKMKDYAANSDGYEKIELVRDLFDIEITDDADGESSPEADGRRQ